MSEGLGIIDAGINFQHPGLQTQQAQPEAPAEPTPAAAPTAPQESTRKLAGKYTSVEELEKGYWNSAQEAQRLVEENRALKAIAAANQRVNPIERTEEREEYIEELRDAALPVEALDRLIENRANRVVQKLFEPIMRGAQARNEMLANVPEFAQAEQELNKFLSANPEINDEYNRLMTKGEERLALKHAFQSYKLQSPQPMVDASGQEQALARATASLPGTQSGPREVTNAFGTRLEEAQARFNLDGDERQLASALFEVFKPNLVNQ